MVVSLVLRGISVGHISPEAAAGGTIALLEQGISFVSMLRKVVRSKSSDEELDKRKRMETTRTESENRMAWALRTNGNIGEYRCSPKSPKF